MNQKISAIEAPGMSTGLCVCIFFVGRGGGWGLGLLSHGLKLG